MAEMDEARLVEIEARANAATEGPWYQGSEAPQAVVLEAYDADDMVVLWLDESNAPEADAAFIAHARTDVPALIAALRQAWAERDAAAEEARTLRTKLARAAALAGKWQGAIEVHPTLHRSLDGDTPHQEKGRYAAGVVRDCARELRKILADSPAPAAEGDAR